MHAAFGSRARTVLEPDQLGRPRSRLVLEWVGLGEPVQGTVSFDPDDLDVLARTPEEDWTRILGGWTPPAARPLLPWAVIHRAVGAPVVRHVHSDAICAIAAAPEGASILAGMHVPGLSWVAYDALGPALAARLAEASLAEPSGAAVVPHIGVFAWGATEVDVDGRCEAIDAAAATWIARRAGGSEAPGPIPDGGTDPEGEKERRLCRQRGRASTSGPAVLAVDASLLPIACRPDLARILEDAGRSDVTWPWTVGSLAMDGGDDAPDPSGGRIHVVPGIGLISAGVDEAAARALGIVAGHVARVAAIAVDVLDGGTPMTDAERSIVPAPIEPAPAGGGLLRGRVYIVTGAASGIGRDVARHLAALGACLAIGDLNGAALEVTADELEPVAGRPVTVAGDLTDEAVVERLVGAAIGRFGGIDGAVLNAGIALPGKIRDLATADWRRSLDVNATSHFLLVRRLLPVLETQGIGGSLVFIGSKNMFSPGAGFGAYSASKAALAQLARVVAIEAGPFGVRSNIVNPDNVFGGSALWSPELRAQRAAVYGIRPEDLEDYYTQRNLMKVPITGDDIARAVAFLLSDDAKCTTACVLTVDGGVPGVFPR